MSGMLASLFRDPLLLQVCAGTAAVAFALAAAHKLRAPQRFAATLISYQVLPRAIVERSRLLLAAALALTGAECAVVVGLVTGGTRGRAALLGLALLLLYSGALGANLVRGRRELDCGCAGFGRRAPIGASLLLRNALLAGALAMATVTPQPRALGWIDASIALAAVASTALLLVAFEVVRDNDAAARQRGRALAEGQP